MKISVWVRVCFECLINQGALSTGDSKDFVVYSFQLGLLTQLFVRCVDPSTLETQTLLHKYGNHLKPEADLAGVSFVTIFGFHSKSH